MVFVALYYSLAVRLVREEEPQVVLGLGLGYPYRKAVAVDYLHLVGVPIPDVLHTHFAILDVHVECEWHIVLLSILRPQRRFGYCTQRLQPLDRIPCKFFG